MSSELRVRGSSLPHAQDGPSSPQTINTRGLGLDAGGTTTRWMLLDQNEHVVVEGKVAGLSGLHMNNELGIRRLRNELSLIRDAILPHKNGLRINVVGGFTGVDGHSPELAALIAEVLAIDETRVRIMSDIEVAYRGEFAPGEGYIVYAGTGSIAAFIDSNNEFQRAGGRGVGLDDGGGGYWMAREALRHIWRREDEQPGAWKNSPLAYALFKRIGSSDWADSRTFFYSRERGEIGALAVAIAETADADPISRDILRQAGNELARLGAAMTNRFGARPIALAGRAAKMHPIIDVTFRERLPRAQISFIETAAHRSAAKLALHLRE
jgi:glucosamine kinase